MLGVINWRGAIGFEVNASEEGLRLAIRTRNKAAENVARNNLGVILKGAANRHIRNQRLANVHLYDGRESRWGPDNLMWNHYLKEIVLSPTEIANLRKTYLGKNKSPHRTESLPELPKSYSDNPSLKIEYLKRLFQPGDLDLAKVRQSLQFDAQLRELTICTVAIVNRAPYELEQHLPFYRAAGGTTEKCEALHALGSNNKVPGVFSALEGDIIKIALQMTQAIEVESDLKARLLRVLEAQQLVELVGVISTYNMVSRFLVALDLHAE